MESFLSKYLSGTSSQFYCDGILVEGDLYSATPTTVNARIESVSQLYFQTSQYKDVISGKILEDIGSSQDYIIADTNIETYKTNHVYSKFRIYPVNCKIRIKEVTTTVSKVTGKPVSSPTTVWSDYYPCHIYEKEATSTAVGVKQTYKVITGVIPNLKDSSFAEIDILGERQLLNFFKQNGVYHFEV